MNNTKLIRILAKGGVLTPGYMLQILEIAESNDNDCVHFGSRQDVVFKVKNSSIKNVTEKLSEEGIQYEFKGADYSGKQNIVSSYIANGILPATRWVNESAYLYVLEQFDYLPKLKINIVDPKQNIMPLFYGFLNFVASESDGYWFLYINKAIGENVIKCPYLIQSSEIASLSKYIEEVLISNKKIDFNDLLHSAKTSLLTNPASADTDPAMPTSFFPYYEGLNKMLIASDYWAGFYWRNNKYTIAFLKRVCHLCAESNIAKISITPWKTFLVKDIQADDLINWQKLIGEFGINMRHSSFELNWHLPLLKNEAYQLKKYIVNQFDKIDIRTYGLTLSIDHREYPDVLTSIHIVRKKLPQILSWIRPLYRYDIKYARNFNPNTNEYITYAENLSRDEILVELVDLSKKYYGQLSYIYSVPKKTKKEKINFVLVHQCKTCATIFDKNMGDPYNNIPAGIAFDELPQAYTCYTCESPKSNFVEIKLDRKYLTN